MIHTVYSVKLSQDMNLIATSPQDAEKKVRQHFRDHPNELVAYIQQVSHIDDLVREEGKR